MEMREEGSIEFMGSLDGTMSEGLGTCLARKESIDAVGVRSEWAS